MSDGTIFTIGTIVVAALIGAGVFCAGYEYRATGRVCAQLYPDVNVQDCVMSGLVGGHGRRR